MAREYNSISMPATPMYPSDGSFEGKIKRQLKKIFSFGKKKDGSLDKSRSGSEIGSSSRDVEEEGQRSSRRFGIFKRPKNKPVDDNPANILTEAKASITDNAQQAEGGEKHGILSRFEELHIPTNRHSEPAPKEEHKLTQPDHRAGNANKHELKETAEAEAVRVQAAKKDPSPADGETTILVKKDGETTTNPGSEAAAGEKRQDATDHPLGVKEPNGCETFGKGLQRVCLPWTVSKDD